MVTLLSSMLIDQVMLMNLSLLSVMYVVQVLRHLLV
jgi:hypothetical protein